jgi:hypothetical protein
MQKPDESGLDSTLEAPKGKALSLRVFDPYLLT